MLHSSRVPSLVPPRPNMIRGWWDASDLSTITNVSGVCSAWADKSKRQTTLTQGTAGARPTITTIRGKRVLSFDGGDHLTSTAPFIYNMGRCTVYSVAEQTTIGAEGIIWDEGQSASNNGQYRLSIEVSGSQFLRPFQRDNALSIKYDFGGSSGLGGSRSTFIDRGTSVAEFGNKGASATTSYTRGTLSTARFTIGAHLGSSVTGPLTGWIGEVLVYFEAHEADVRNQVQAYLKRKWGF